MALTLKARRRLAQLAVAAAFVVAPWRPEEIGPWLRGNLLSCNLAGLPLSDPLAALQAALGSWSLKWELGLGMALALGLALVLGPVFCSWACPFGLLSELGQGLRARLRPGGRGQPGRGNGFTGKAALTGLALAAATLAGLPPLLNQLSLPGWWSRLFQGWFLQGHLSWAGLALAAILGLELAAGRRLWCRYLCPQSVLPMLCARALPAGLRLRFAPRRCVCRGQEDPCAAACSLGLNPRGGGRSLLWECNNCGDCLEVCRGRGRALTLSFGGAGDERPERGGGAG